MRVFKVELMIVDHDGVGEDGVISMLENARYPNRAISPTVMGVKSREIEWTDDHPLNKFSTMSTALKELFQEEEPGGDRDLP